ncbi:MAG: Very-short-patch mismatch repair endonuclease (G-T specific), partial [uncultured Actinomycetospora sp.]
AARPAGGRSSRGPRVDGAPRLGARGPGRGRRSCRGPRPVPLVSGPHELLGDLV